MFNSLDRAATWLSRNRTRHHLLSLDDRALEDRGFSRAALMDGNRAFPWRATADSLPHLRAGIPLGALVSSQATAPTLAVLMGGRSGAAASARAVAGDAITGDTRRREAA